MSRLKAIDRLGKALGITIDFMEFNIQDLTCFEKEDERESADNEVQAIIANFEKINLERLFRPQVHEQARQFTMEKRREMKEQTARVSRLEYVVQHLDYDKLLSNPKKKHLVQ